MNLNIKEMKRHYIGISVVALILLLWPCGLAAQQGAMRDGINDNLVTPGNLIYYGTYHHANELREFNNNDSVIKRESTATPIMWRIMGAEANAVTLLSHYVLDSRIFGLIGQKWSDTGTAELHKWLNGNATDDFPNNFKQIELNLVKSSTVYAPVYDTLPGMSSVSIPTSNPTSTSNTRFYLLWGKPQRPLDNNQSKVFWGLSSIANPPIESHDLTIKTAALKGNPNNPVRYWLRSQRGGVPDQITMVKTPDTSPADTIVDMAAISVKRGVRPMFRLDTANVIFAAELRGKTFLEQWDQEESDNTPVDGFYRDGDMLSTEIGGSPKAYKLTIWDNNPTLQSPSDYLTYDYDETLAINGTVALRANDTLRLNFNAISPISANYDGVAYKLIRENSTPRALLRYGYTPKHGNDSIEIVARDINRDSLTIVSGSGFTNIPNPIAGQLAGNCDAYVWRQKNNQHNSHFGTTPMPFKLHIMVDNAAPRLTQVGKIVRKRSTANPTIADSAIVTFKIQEDIGGKYYYLVDPVTPPTSVVDFIGGAAFISSGKKLFATGNPTITDTIIGFTDNDPHSIYILAKDSVRNESQILALTIPQAIPNTKPDSIPITINMRPGERKTIPISSIANDPDIAIFGDVLKITSIDVPADGNIVSTATILQPDSARLEIRAGLVTGDTAIYVTVKDYELDSTKCRIGIIVRELQPTAEIDFIKETLVNLQTPGRYLFTSADTVIDLILSSGDDVPIDKKWFGATLDIVKLDPATGVTISVTQQLSIPLRPIPPVVHAYNESYDGFFDGRIVFVNDSMEYSSDSTLVDWIAIIKGKKEIVNLQPGVYHVRYKAIQGERFVSFPTMATVERGVAYPQFNREIILPVVDGVTTEPTAGSHRVVSSSSFTFTVTFSGAQLVVKTNRDADGEMEVLTGIPNGNGGFDYTIRRITTTPIAVFIGPETVANEVLGDLSNGAVIWAYRGVVYIRSKQSGVANVYTLSGTLAAQVKTIEGETASVALPIGLYIVATSDGAYAKVVVK